MKRSTALWNDRRGSIAYLGLVMAPVLAAACWYELTVWRQIVHRERIQIAADAIAAGGAAWLAAGMNILALINVVMGIALSVFVAIRAAEILMVALSIFFVGLSFLVPPAAGWAVTTANWAERAFSMEQRVAPRVMRGLTIATQAEVMVARAFPYISLITSPLYARQPDTQSGGFGFAANFALVPTLLDRTVSAVSTAPAAAAAHLPGRAGNAASNSAANQGGVRGRMGAVHVEESGNGGLRQRLAALSQGGLTNVLGSLPVEAEDYQQLCARAAGEWSNMPFVRNLPFAERFGDALGLLGGNLTPLLCQPLSEAADILAQGLESQIQEQLPGARREEANRWATQRCQEEADRDGENFRARQQRRNRNRSRSQLMAQCVRGRAGEWLGQPRYRAERERFEDDYRSRQRAEFDRVQQRRAQETNTDNIKTAKRWGMISDTAHTLAAGNGVRKLESNPFLSSLAQYQGASGEQNAGAIHSPVIRRLAGVSTAPARVQGFEMDWSSARARIYFDCAARDVLNRQGADDGIHICADNAMWRPGGWRWLMAVDRPALDDLADAGRQALAGVAAWFTGAVAQDLLGRAVRSDLAAGHARHVQPQLGHIPHWSSRIAGMLSSGNGSYAAHASDWWIGSMGGTAAGNLVNGNPWSTGVYPFPPYLR